MRAGLERAFLRLQNFHLLFERVLARRGVVKQLGLCFFKLPSKVGGDGLV
jgi:hypothetical protein